MVAAAAMILSASQMLQYGLVLLGVIVETQARRSRARNIDDFKAHFGPHPLHAARCWQDILTCQQTCPAAYINPLVADIDAFFWAVCFLRLYDTERFRATRFDAAIQTMIDKSSSHNQVRQR